MVESGNLDFPDQRPGRLALFFWWEQQVPHPVFDLALFKDLTAGSPSLWASFSRA
jgi:hypothetical protein